MTKFRFMMLFIVLLIPTSGTAETTALHWAAISGDVAKVKKLLEGGADVEARAANGWTALYTAAWERHRAVVTVLLAAGAETEARMARADGRRCIWRPTRDTGTL